MSYRTQPPVLEQERRPLDCMLFVPSHGEGDGRYETETKTEYQTREPWTWAMFMALLKKIMPRGIMALGIMPRGIVTVLVASSRHYRTLDRSAFAGLSADHEPGSQAMRHRNWKDEGPGFHGRDKRVIDPWSDI